MNEATVTCVDGDFLHRSPLDCLTERRLIMLAEKREECERVQEKTEKEDNANATAKMQC